MKLLAIGDMHLGRVPSWLPPELDTSELGPAEAWRRSVDAAVEAGVTAVLLAGDVVDREDDFFEAYRALASGVETLDKAAVGVIGVAGNHDVVVLPRLAEQIPAFRLLGRAGTWESCEVSDGREAVTLWGWSFPQARVVTSPLENQVFDRKPGINLGLLHCNLDAPLGSPYAPVPRRELDRAGLDGWLLGHIHTAGVLTRESLTAYLGSLTCMVRGESGIHGPWMITVTGGRIAEVEQLPLAPLRWEELKVEAEGIGEPAEIKGRLLESVRELDRCLSSLSVAPLVVGLSVTIRGRTCYGQVALEILNEEKDRTVFSGSKGTEYYLQKARCETRPEIALGDLAKRLDPVGLLAKRLLWLERPEGDSERDRLVGVARRRLEDQSNKSVWRVPEASFDGLEPVTLLKQAGYRALDRLLYQEREAQGAD